MNTNNIAARYYESRRCRFKKWIISFGEDPFFYCHHVVVSVIVFQTYKHNDLRPMGDPYATVKLSEVFSDCYVEQHDDYRKLENLITLI